MDKARETALKILYKIDEENAYSNIVLNNEIKKQKENLNAKDISLISEIIYGVTTWKLTLDEIIKKYSKIKLKKISKWILNILRMSIYQIIFLDKIPKSAAVNEGVKLAKRYGNKGSVGFVNAVLRKVDKKDYTELFEEKDNIKRISKITSMPEWIILELKKEGLSLEQIEKICKCSNIRPNISIRVNNLKISKQELKEKLQNKGIEVEDGILNDFLIIKKAKEILEKISQDKNERYLAELREKYIMDQKAIEGAGYDKGLNDGVKQGRKQGEEKKTIELAKKMKQQGIDIEVIKKITELSLDKINEL